MGYSNMKQVCKLNLSFIYSIHRGNVIAFQFYGMESRTTY
jgi:hypothetical protein